ncbi:MAG TPA: chlorite dismutase family protein [Longimicrobiales bacterium]|jgi:chlorite dismutase
MSDSPLAPLVLDGWFVLHQLFHIDRFARDDEARRGRGQALAELFASWEDLGDDGWSGLYRIVGGGADVLAIHFRPTLDALGVVERELATAEASADLVPVQDYVSVVELGLYAITVALLEKAAAEGVEVRSEAWDALVAETLETESRKAYSRRRLQPVQPPGMPYVCFYPMDKRRAPGQNWYALPLEERAALMLDHGSAGRRYAGRIAQVISGSVGLDDWEWGVTLFAGDPLDFKALVTEMRYDEVSSVYAEFGSFWVGRRVPTDEIAGEVGG